MFLNTGMMPAVSAGHRSGRQEMVGKAINY